MFCAAFAWYLPSGSIACVIDQLTETFEFLFSSIPLKKSYLLSNPAAETMASQLMVTFFVTAIPSYTIGHLAQQSTQAHGRTKHVSEN